MERFSKDRRLIIPQKNAAETDEEGVRYVVTEAYVQNSCKIIDRGQRT